MTHEQLHEDIAFLAPRCANAGRIGLSDNERDYGLSSNSIVGIAYGYTKLVEQYLPSDESDLAACERMWAKLPEHRKTTVVVSAMEAARQHIQNKYKPNLVTKKAEESNGNRV